MADVIAFPIIEKVADPQTYTVDVSCYPDNLLFTLNDIQVNPGTLQKIAADLEKIAQIIRTDVITRVI